MSDRYFDPKLPFDITRRNLPHWTQQGAIHMVTFRLDDSLPKYVVEALKAERAQWLAKHQEPLTAEQKIRFTRIFNNKVERVLDAGYGSCKLKDERIAKIVEDSIWFHHNKKYTVYGYVIMSNHVHLLVLPYAENAMKGIMQGIKSYTSHAINELLGTKGVNWTSESYDRLIRGADHYHYARNYLLKNVAQGAIRWYLHEEQTHVEQASPPVR